ncbi:MAG: hypothetical protein K8T10_11580 [Candidatus Eremiobacteraeota bacterium]|nr:hypothetical protein [Candidatus Eremiobacteraeota bacterium]
MSKIVIKNTNDKSINESENRDESAGQMNKGNKEKSPPRNVRDTILLIFLVIQIFLIIFLLYRFAAPEHQDIMILETSLEKGDFVDPNDFILAKYDILDTVTLMTGIEQYGRSADNILRKKMVYDKGQSFWILMEDKVSDSDELLKYSKEFMAPSDFTAFAGRIKNDEVLNFLYDLGGKEKIFRNNWREVGVEELKAAPFLPWKKKLDFMVLSRYDESHWGGIEYILGYNPAMPIYCPPLTKLAQLKNFKAMSRAQSLIPLLPGYTQLTPRVGAYVSTIQMESGEDPRYELDIVLKVNGGVAVVAGAGLAEPLDLVRNVKSETGEDVLYYIGGTNLFLGLKTKELYSQMRELKKIAPNMEVYPNFNTSMIAHQMMKEVFEDKYHPTSQGLKIRFRPKPKLPPPPKN